VHYLVPVENHWDYIMKTTLIRLPFFLLPIISLFAATLSPVGQWNTGVFDEGAAEIVQFNPETNRLFIVNGDIAGVDVVDISDPTTPTKLFSITVEDFGSSVQSVAVFGNLVALAVSADPATAPGWVAFYNTDGLFLNKVQVGSLPDMVTFSPDGSLVLTANEGEPSDDYSVDPTGSISIIQLGADFPSTSATVTTLDFTSYDGQEIPGSHPGNPASSLSQNLEPEYIAVAPNGKMALVTIQESNAVALIDLAKMEITSLVGLGYKDHSKFPLDASDKDDAINIRNWPVLGLYQPDSVVAFEIGGETYFAIANEGDARDYDGWSEEVRVEDLTLDPDIFPNADELQDKTNLGRLKTTTAAGDIDGDGDHDKIFSYGGRSFSILDSTGTMIFDSGSELEEKLAAELPENFNSNNDENDSFDKRSDDKGPEPEAITFANVNGIPLLFVGMERVGGIVVYDLTDPTDPEWLTYSTTRDFSGNAEKGTAGDLGPEGIIVISAEDSPTGLPLLVVANEVSGTVTLFEISTE